MKRSYLLLLAPVLGCGNCDPEQESSGVSQLIEAGSPIAAVVSGGVGVGGVEVQVRLVNAYGVAVPGEVGQVQVSIAGVELDTSSAQVQIDALGYGAVQVSSPVPQTLALSVLEASDGASAGGVGQAWILGGEAPVNAFFPGWGAEIEPSYLQALDQGMVFSIGAKLYWQDGAAGSPRSEVASLPSDVQGLVSADFDRDGIEDALVWTVEEVILLRGRFGGGFSWGAGWSVPSQGIRGVGVGDANLDGIQDLVIAYGVDSTGGFEVLLGSGAWTFESNGARGMDEDIWSVALCQLNDDGRADVAVLVDDGSGVGAILRYGPDNTGNWSNNDSDLAGQSLALPLTRGSRLQGCTDLKGTPETQELIAVGAKDDPQRPLLWYSFDGGGTTEFKLSYSGYQVATGDLSGDGVDDVVVSEQESQQVRVLTWRPEQGNFLNDGVVAVPMSGPIGVSDMDGDGTADVLMTSTIVALYPGEIVEGRWRTIEDDFLVYGVDDDGVQQIAELDGGGYPELVAVRFFEGETTLQIFNWVLSEENRPMIQSPSGSRESLDGGSSATVAEALDLAICGSVVWVLVEDSGGWLYRAEIGAQGKIEDFSSAPVDGDFVACGEMGDASVVVASSAGNWNAYNDNMQKVDSGALGGQVGDIALADIAGAGLSLQFCDAVDCNLVAADLDGDDVDELLQGGGTPQVQAWGQTLDFELPGIVSAFDWDGDGRLDVAITDTNLERVVIYRSLEQSFAPPLIMHGVRDLEGPAQAADLNGDSVPELLVPVTGGNLLLAPSEAP